MRGEISAAVQTGTPDISERLQFIGWRTASVGVPGERTANNEGGWLLLGLSHRDLGAHVQAIAAFENAIRLNPNRVEAWQWLGIAHADTNNRRGALEAYEKLKNLNAEKAEEFYQHVIRTHWPG